MQELDCSVTRGERSMFDVPYVLGLARNPPHVFALTQHKMLGSSLVADNPGENRFYPIFPGEGMFSIENFIAMGTL
jgi:hypothetical protein